MREKIIELSMIDGNTYFVDTRDMNSLGIADNPESYIGSFMSGSRGPMMRVNSVADLTGVEVFINPQMIVSMRVSLV